jgi:AcrR family transcriptional regulator
MARPLSDKKRDAILAAATEAVAALGVGASTAKIAAAAGVAEGTLFTYFDSKDALLNDLYVELKQELAAAIMAGDPSDGTLPERWRQVWDSFIDWGAANRSKRKAIRQLNVSDRITDASRQIAACATQDIAAVLYEGLNAGILRDQPPDFVAAIFEAMGEMTLDFIAREPARLLHYKQAGFAALWNAIARH